MKIKIVSYLILKKDGRFTWLFVYIKCWDQIRSKLFSNFDPNANLAWLTTLFEFYKFSSISGKAAINIKFFFLI